MLFCFIATGLGPEKPALISILSGQFIVFSSLRTVVESSADNVKVDSVPLSGLVEIVLPRLVAQPGLAVSVSVPGHDPGQPALRHVPRSRRRVTRARVFVTWWCLNGKKSFRIFLSEYFTV